MDNASQQEQPIVQRPQERTAAIDALRRSWNIGTYKPPGISAPSQIKVPPQAFATALSVNKKAAYEIGFIRKCAERGVDPKMLIKLVK